MFTGIIEETGRIESLRLALQGATLRISSKTLAPALKPGDSIAVNGVCLTVTVCDDTTFVSDLSAETLERTSFAQAREGTTVNLERSLLVGSRLGGHFVLGHVDSVGRLLDSKSVGPGVEMRFGFPRDIDRYLVYKGSIAVDGISLTISSLEDRSFSVSVVPHTLRNTNLQSLRTGDAVNLEVDILGKYFERFCKLGLVSVGRAEITVDYLKEQGF